MLGLVNRVAFELFGLPIYWYAIIIVSGVIIAMWLSTREAVRVGLKPDDVTDFMLIGLPVAIIGARLYYILFDLQYYIDDPSQIFNIRSGGIAIYGALIAGGIWLYFFCQRNFISPWTFLDIAAPSVLLAQGIGRWGNFMNHEAFGAEVSRSFLESLYIPKFIIDNMYIDEAYRQPTFLYESVWNVIGFIVLIFLRKKTGLLKEGEVFLSYLIWYGFGRFFIEGMRTDSLYLFGGIRVSQALSALLFFGAIGLLIWRRKNQTLKDYNRSFDKNQTII
ncbi:prolipoprotein diacylglyceryl transferase [Enterococcus casseliflavus]|uniref:prolipoprotein diacylglyceryl transferase n=1 Tax=Enterococcus casseliflavus TaxID=37734 RepID=UPI001E60F5D4|nr:prolipoprotein diacylglyceryl transferase [Enterococcus casseliflavus]MCD5201504.1 prolipoprotein diacylglyceryl transferase [Enterococcus casseliflavus]MDV7737119.1 prolipoprotein diacylglyceryl transferase [Enterococcus casseliflavus]MDV7751128.1 prolipoprotein diacylglyceryl transferase [Enterococcus casseliflavus]UQZ97097.1 prolipoprotein diacylglyceryl transferase [Enterococcus casseliflavus]WRO95599.1 prolipoprotein diacylglyceryl transferase [Enterococcus casseliflavus]